MPPPGVMPPPGMLPQGTPPFQPGMSRPPLGPPPAFVPAGSPFAPSGINGAGTPTTPVVGSGTPTPVPLARPAPPVGSVSTQNQPPVLALPNAALEQKYTPFKKKTELKYADPNFSPVRLLHFLVSIDTNSDLCTRKRNVHIRPDITLPRNQQMLRHHHQQLRVLLRRK